MRRTRHAPAPVAGASRTRRVLHLLRVSAALAVLALLLGACIGEDAVTGEDVPGVRAGVTLPAPEDREPAPTDVAVQVLGEEEGTTLSLGDFAGEVVVLNFWASWCGPCRVEQPDLNEAAAALEGEPVAFLGVNIDDTEPNALAHVREYDIPYPSLFDPSVGYAARFGGVGPRSIPSTILIDTEGRVAARLFGITDFVEVTALADRLAQEAAAA